MKSVYLLTTRYSEDEGVTFKTWGYTTLSKAQKALKKWTDSYKTFYPDEIEEVEENVDEVMILLNGNRLYRGYIDEITLNEPSTFKFDF